MNSKQIEKYIIKNCMHNIDEWRELDEMYLKTCFCYNRGHSKFEIIDEDDWYRMNYIKRKQPFPVSIYYTMSEGMVEDFWGAWCSENEDTDLYDPDIDWRIIFPVP